MGPIIIPDATTEPAAYVARLLEVLGPQDPVSIYRTTIENVRELVDGLRDDEWLSPLADGEWNVHQVLGHLVDVDIVYGFRWRLILTADEPTYPGYDERGWAVLPKPKQRSLLATFGALRNANAILIESIPHESWRRRGVHGEQGPEDVELMIRKIAGHDLAHLDQLRRTADHARRISAWKAPPATP
jgi:hypothetical protein